MKRYAITLQKNCHVFNHFEVGVGNLLERALRFLMSRVLYGATLRCNW